MWRSLSVATLVGDAVSQPMATLEWDPGECIHQPHDSPCPQFSDPPPAGNQEARVFPDAVAGI